MKCRRVVNNEIFFEADITTRLHNLYDEYKSHPKLALGVAREADGKTYDPETSGESPHLQAALRQGEHPFLQACMYLEHRARLAVMKASVDLSIESGGDPWEDPGGNLWTRVLRFSLPDSFRVAMTNLLTEPYFHLYPKFWQSYLWSWGGFYLKDRAEQEFQAMSSDTGIPSEHIPDALEVFDKLFPIPNGWEWEVGNASWRQVKLMPWPFRGLGAARRRILYGVDEYSKLGYTDWTGPDLAKWHNSFVYLLAGTEDTVR